LLTGIGKSAGDLRNAVVRFEIVRIRLDSCGSEPGELLLPYFDLIAIGFVH
jgi:hypothetical protein